MALQLALWRDFAKKTVILASASPRRREILNEMGLAFQVITTLEPDRNNPAAYDTPGDYVVDTARMKAEEVFGRCHTPDSSHPRADMVIGADTVVVVEGEVQEKPVDVNDARRMLQKLSGNTQQVYTGVALVYINAKGGVSRHTFVESTRVTFSTLDPETIEAYIATGEPFDKAGGYGIQGQASVFVESIQGDFWNVVGLPKNRLYRELKQISQDMFGERTV